MRRLSICAGIVAALASGSASYANGGPEPLIFVAKLVSYQEVPSVSSVARGRIAIEIDEDAQVIRYALNYADLEGTVTMAHIHFGQASVNGAVMLWLCQTDINPAPPAATGTPVCPAPGGEVTGELRPANVIGQTTTPNQGIAPGEFAELIRAIRSGVTYANVHSSKFPGGEIRGQLRRVYWKKSKHD